MFVLAHVLGIPVEELIMPWIGGGVCAGMLMVFATKIGNLVPLKLRPHNRQAHCAIEKES